MLAGLQQKFKIHAQPEKAAALESLVKRYRAGEVWNVLECYCTLHCSVLQVWSEPHEQHDLQYRLLALLLQLADSPLHTEYHAPAPALPSPTHETDWLALLREGEESDHPLDSESELSDWSECEESKSDASPPSAASPVRPLEEEAEVESEAERWLTKHVQSPYWLEVGLGAGRLTEWQVCRELLWALRCPAPSPLLQQPAGPGEAWQLRPGLTTPTLPHPALSHMLAHPLEAVNQVSISACLYRRKPNGAKVRRFGITFVLKPQRASNCFIPGVQIAPVPSYPGLGRLFPRHAPDAGGLQQRRVCTAGGAERGYAGVGGGAGKAAADHHTPLHAGRSPPMAGYPGPVLHHAPGKASCSLLCLVTPTAQWSQNGVKAIIFDFLIFFY